MMIPITDLTRELTKLEDQLKGLRERLVEAKTTTGERELLAAVKRYIQAKNENTLRAGDNWFAEIDAAIAMIEREMEEK
tara:strand:- start:771 stop:1007 length:237 start_codon:yes stop_codon:yes gene_type:complete